MAVAYLLAVSHFTTRGSFILIVGIFSQPFSLSKLKETGGVQSSHPGHWGPKPPRVVAAGAQCFARGVGTWCAVEGLDTGLEEPAELHGGWVVLQAVQALTEQE